MFYRTSLILSFLVLFSCDSLKQFALKPTHLEVVQALREVLNSSAFRAVSSLKQIHAEGPEVLLPEEFRPVIGTLRSLGLSGEIDKVTGQIGNASLFVLNESTALMEDAIRQVDFGDAVAIVTGGRDAATQVLKNNMYISVKNRYSAMLEEELGKTDALRYWPMAVNAYNLFSSNKMNVSLPDFMAEKAVDILFASMGHQEVEIRNDYASLGKAVVTKVFDYYTKPPS
ncbi:MAG TPA: DUF4197 domain-containing protein [Saprospiraceae bacterium]|nr:DUF4197 domain-containing protein [Saprospiraceae bacterium]